MDHVLLALALVAQAVQERGARLHHFSGVLPRGIEGKEQDVGRTGAIAIAMVMVMVMVMVMAMGAGGSVLSEPLCDGLG